MEEDETIKYLKAAFLNAKLNDHLFSKESFEEEDVL